MAKISVGDTVRMTGKFLRNTGQQVGGEGKKHWTVKDIQGSFAVVDEDADTSYFTAEEMQKDPSLRWRRINVGNLEPVRGHSAAKHEAGKNPEVSGFVTVEEAETYARSHIPPGVSYTVSERPNPGNLARSFIVKWKRTGKTGKKVRVSERARDIARQIMLHRPDSPYRVHQHFQIPEHAAHRIYYAISDHFGPGGKGIGRFEVLVDRELRHRPKLLSKKELIELLAKWLIHQHPSEYRGHEASAREYWKNPKVGGSLYYLALAAKNHDLITEEQYLAIHDSVIRKHERGGNPRTRRPKRAKRSPGRRKPKSRRLKRATGGGAAGGVAGASLKARMERALGKFR